MKQFNSEYHQDYYKGWVYLDTINKKDYYIQCLPSKENPYPWTSIVYGEEPNEYLSTTLSIKDVLDTERALAAIKFYLEHYDCAPYLHMIALIREYAECNIKNTKEEV